MSRNTAHDTRRPFSHYLLIAMVLLIILVASGITVIDYLQAKDNYERNAAFLEAQTEKNLVQSIEIIDSGLMLFDDSQDERLREGFVTFMNEYKRAGRDPSRMDLEKVRSAIGKNADVYIINESGVIEYTTYTPDLGLDFRTVPYFNAYLTKVRMSEGYFSDRVVQELNTGQYRKFAYMPTPDHKYVLEIGLVGPLYDRGHLFESYQKNLDQIAYVNPFVTEVVIFDTNKQPINGTAYTSGGITDTNLDTVIAERGSLRTSNPSKGSKTTYLFVDLHNDKYGSDVSQIARITYDTTLIEKQLNDLLLSHLIIGTLAILLGILVAIILSRFLAKPVYQIVSDVDSIAQGDLTHRISPTIGREFALLETSVSTMVATLTTTIDREKASEMRYRHLVENIPDVIWTISSEGRLVYVSPNIERVLGYTCDEAYTLWGEQVLGSVHSDDSALVHAEFSSLFTKRMIDIEYQVERKDGTWAWVHTRSISIYERDGTWYADGIFSDITDRKQAEMRLRRFSEELEKRVSERTAELEKTENAFCQANKKLNLLSSITRHDIMNQLTIMSGYMKLAAERSSDPESKKYLATAQKAADVIDRHMIFTRLYQNVGVKAPSWQNVKTILERVRLDLPHDRILLEVDTGNLELYADPLLEKVFYTLMENTIRHGEQATRIRVSFTLRDNGLTLVYEDNGTGVNPVEKERIFEWGYGKHTGFGLFLAREILAITGLTIRETGEPGSGARFEIEVTQNAYRITPPAPKDE